MPSLADAFDDESENQRRALANLTGTFKVATTAPFTVYINGGTDPMPAHKLVGASYSVGTTGVYLLVGIDLVCLPTTT